jgi:hypothetical protein
MPTKPRSMSSQRAAAAPSPGPTSSRSFSSLTRSQYSSGQSAALYRLVARSVTSIPAAPFVSACAPAKVFTDETASAWWEKLRAFILCQETATETGLWPSEAQLSHGEGGEVELGAERAAEQLGLLPDYREAVAFGTGLIASGLAKINKKTGLLRNGRSACICGRVDRHRRAVLRRECHRSGLGCPIVLEQRRRIKVDEYWRGLRGQACCGTMRECPLKEAADPISVPAPTVGS